MHIHVLTYITVICIYVYFNIISENSTINNDYIVNTLYYTVYNVYNSEMYSAS